MQLTDEATKLLRNRLTPWDRVQLARHAQRPHTLDYVKTLFTDFVELHGDRRHGDDLALVGGPAKLNGRTVMIVGHQKGVDAKENVTRNFGMPRPEGYRKAIRLMEHAEKFGFPVVSFIDTPGADPGLESEERGQAQAIAESLAAMARLAIPIVAVVIGEGGSGGALAIGLADRILMLENSVYSVASPEACAAILWRDASQAPKAAEAMRITAQDLSSFGIVDEIIAEPAAGAHTDVDLTLNSVRESLLRHLSQLELIVASRPNPGVARLLDLRYQKFRQIGRWQISSDPALPSHPKVAS